MDAFLCSQIPIRTQCQGGEGGPRGPTAVPAQGRCAELGALSCQASFCGGGVSLCTWDLTPQGARPLQARQRCVLGWAPLSDEIGRIQGGMAVEWAPLSGYSRGGEGRAPAFSGAGGQGERAGDEEGGTRSLEGAGQSRQEPQEGQGSWGRRGTHEGRTQRGLLPGLPFPTPSLSTVTLRTPAQLLLRHLRLAPLPGGCGRLPAVLWPPPQLCPRRAGVWGRGSLTSSATAGEAQALVPPSPRGRGGAAVACTPRCAD